MGTTEDITLACTAEQYLVELRRQSKQAGELIAGLTVAQFNWQPNAGRSWSIAQCLEHLTATNQVYLAAIRPAVQSSRGSQAEIVYRPGGWLTSRFIASMEPPPKQKFRAFRKIQPKPSQYRSEEVLSHFLSEQEDLAKFVSDSRQLDLGRIRFWNPFLKGVLFTVSSGLLLIGAHNRRHLWQAERVKEGKGFPS